MVVDFGESTRGLKISGHRDSLPGSQSGQSMDTKLASLGALEKGMANQSSILAWRILWTEEPGGLWSIRSQRVGCD